MDLLDDQGRLFGLVNVVDAFVLFLVAAVVVAGVAFVLQPDPASGTGSTTPETATQTITLDLGTRPAYLVEQIRPGDTYSPAANSELTVTDIYVAPQDGGTRVILSVSLQGVASGETVAYNGAPPRLGRQLTLQTSTYQVSGEIRDVGGGLDTSTTGVLLDVTVDASTVGTIEPGDTYTLGGHDVATVESVEVFSTQDPDVRRVFLGLSLRTLDFGNGPRFGTTPVRQGLQVPFRTDNYQIKGTIRDIGSGLERQTTRVLVRQTVNGSTANAIQPGDAYSIAGREAATVESVDVFATANPDRRRIFVGLALQTVVLGNGTTFGTTPIQRGATLSFRTDDYHIRGSIERVGASELRGEPSTRNVTLELGDVSPELANSLRSGLTETIAGQTNARVTGVDTRPSPVIITTDDGRVVVGEHPTRKRVTLTAELSVRETDTGPTFKGRSLQLGRTVPLDLGTVTIEATVIEIGERPA